MSIESVSSLPIPFVKFPFEKRVVHSAWYITSQKISLAAIGVFAVIAIVAAAFLYLKNHFRLSQRAPSELPNMQNRYDNNPAPPLVYSAPLFFVQAVQQTLRRYTEEEKKNIKDLIQNDGVHTNGKEPLYEIYQWSAKCLLTHYLKITKSYGWRYAYYLVPPDIHTRMNEASLSFLKFYEKYGSISEAEYAKVLDHLFASPAKRPDASFGLHEAKIEDFVKLIDRMALELIRTPAFNQTLCPYLKERAANF